MDPRMREDTGRRKRTGSLRMREGQGERDAGWITRMR